MLGESRENKCQCHRASLFQAWQCLSVTPGSQEARVGRSLGEGHWYYLENPSKNK